MLSMEIPTMLYLLQVVKIAAALCLTVKQTEKHSRIPVQIGLKILKV